MRAAYRLTACCARSQSLCMACNPFRAKSVGDGYEKFRSAFECDFSKCQTYLPYMLCPTDACVAK